MLEVYWGCLFGGILFAVVTILFGDLMDGLIDSHVFDPMVLVGGITVFGGAGVALTKYSSLTGGVVAGLSALIAVFVSMLVYFLYVKPMKNSENSVGYSIQDLVGQLGEVSIPLPEQGFGEVLVKVGASNTNQIAASLERDSIPVGTRVVVVEVTDGVLYVVPFE